MKNCKSVLKFLFSEYKADKFNEMAERYLSWTKLETLDKFKFEKVLSLKDCENQGSADVFPTVSENYWSDDAPIDIDLYPAAFSDIYLDPLTGNHFLVYTEFGGHAPELRCRLIQGHLLVSRNMEL